jgi:uncharacterized protein (DUF488 family)
MKIFTIGHSVSTLDAIGDILKAEGIELVVDVRSKPRSQRMPHFDRNPLETFLTMNDIRYRFLGDKLGGMPQDREMIERWRQGHLDPLIVAHLRTTEPWQEGIAELVQLIKSRGGTNVCILCSEGDPNECHRKAVALDAAECLSDLEIVHLSAGKPVSMEVGVQEVMM